MIIEDDETVQELQTVKRKSKKATNWEKLKAQSAIPRVDASGQKFTPAIGKYQVDFWVHQKSTQWFFYLCVNTCFAQSCTAEHIFKIGESVVLHLREGPELWMHY